MLILFINLGVILHAFYLFGKIVILTYRKGGVNKLAFFLSKLNFKPIARLILVLGFVSADFSEKAWGNEKFQIRRKTKQLVIESN